MKESSYLPIGKNLLHTNLSMTRRHAMNNPHTPSRSLPIRIALCGLSNPDEATVLNNLFSHANRWQQPWQVVPDADMADLLLVTANSSEELAGWHSDTGGFTQDRLICYSQQRPQEARWHLRRPPQGQTPSPLEFTILLKEISQALALATPAPTGLQPAPRPRAQPFDWREKLKILIVGSVGSGKTTAISTLCGDKVISTEAAPSDQTQLHKQSTTVAMDFGTLALNEDTQLHVYGAPGQRRFDFMGEILIQKALGIIILVSNAASDSIKELNYYLDAHREFLANHHAVIGVTHNDVSPTPSLNEYTRALQARGASWPIFKVDARQHGDLMQLVTTLLGSTIAHG